MHPLRGLLQPGPIVDSAANHEGLVAPGVRDFVQRSGLGLDPELPELLSNTLGDSLGRSMFACIGNEYSHVCSLLSLRRPSLLCYFTPRKKSTLRTRLTTIMIAINASMPTLVGTPFLLMARNVVSIPIPVRMLNTSRGIAKR